MNPHVDFLGLLFIHFVYEGENALSKKQLFWFSSQGSHNLKVQIGYISLQRIVMDLLFKRSSEMSTNLVVESQR